MVWFDRSCSHVYCFSIWKVLHVRSPGLPGVLHVRSTGNSLHCGPPIVSVESTFYATVFLGMATVNFNQQQLRAIYLAGTVSIPAKFPELAEIRFESISKKQIVVHATQTSSPKLVITRSFFLDDVSSLFLPNDPDCVDLTDGEWYEKASLKSHASDQDADESEMGIIYVREHAQSLLRVEAGMTAAESAEYYPPLPDDRSVNHYEGDSGFMTGCGYL